MITDITAELLTTIVRWLGQLNTWMWGTGRGEGVAGATQQSYFPGCGSIMGSFVTISATILRNLGGCVTQGS